MSILGKHLELVNFQATFHKKMAESCSPKSWRGQKHLETAAKLDALVADLEVADKALDALPATPAIGIAPVSEPTFSSIKKPVKLSLTMEEVAGLPSELLAELNLTDADKTEFSILEALEEAGGIITLDRLLIALYKKTGQIHKRGTLPSRLARMAGKNTIYYVPGKKGVYSSEQLSNEDVARLLGSVKQDAEAEANVTT